MKVLLMMVEISMMKREKKISTKNITEGPFFKKFQQVISEFFLNSFDFDSLYTTVI